MEKLHLGLPPRASILITGASGMVGRNIIEALEPCGFQIFAPSHAELDLLNAERLQAWLVKYQPDCVIHCAGKVGGIQANIANPVGFFNENMLMGLNVINGAHKAGIKRLVNLGSSCMYPRDFNRPLTEDMILTGPLEPTNEGYALAKCSAARLCQYINRQYPEYLYKTIVPCNLYGKYDRFDPEKSHMIPAIIRKIDEAIANNEEAVEIWGDGAARREFMYAGDLAELLRMACERFEEMPAVMNAGLGYDHSVDAYYETAARVLGYKGGFRHNLDKPSGMRRKLVDISRQTSFGFTPRTTLEEGIKKTYAWYKSI